MKYILAHDFGTSGDKASLFTIEGKFVKTKTVGYKTHYSNGTWAEQDPADWWNAFCQSTKELIEGVNAEDILCVAFDGTNPNCLCVDENCNPLYPAILWQDARSSEECTELTELLPKKYTKDYPNGRMKADRTLPKLLWIKKHHPEVFEKTYKVLPVLHNYIIMKLTGKAICDITSAGSTAFMNPERTHWSQEVLDLAGIPMSMLPEVHERTDIVGEITEEFTPLCGLAPGTKLVCGTGDTGCTSIGAGLIKTGDMYFSGGTSAGIVLIPDPEKKPVYKNQLTASSGSSLSWLKNTLCVPEQIEAKETGRDVYDIINEKVDSAPVGSNGVIFHPYLAGEREPRNNPKAKGSFVGISLTTTREDMMRSVIEGIGFNIGVIVDRIRDAGYKVDSLLIVGGLGKGDVTRQIFADIMDVELRALKYMDEAATVGCAVLGGMAMGIYEDESAVEKFMEISSITKPNPENVKKYAKLKPIFEKIYQGLEPVYPDLY